jgi:hypothetical protein
MKNSYSNTYNVTKQLLQNHRHKSAFSWLLLLLKDILERNFHHFSTKVIIQKPQSIRNTFCIPTVMSDVSIFEQQVSAYYGQVLPVKYKFLYSFKYNQQDATLHNILYCCQCCTCFGRFLRPSSGAQ